MEKNLDAVNFDFCLLEYYKKLKITEEELSVILMIDHLLSQNNTFITNDLLALRMNYDTVKIDDLVCSLLTKGFLEYTTNPSSNFLTTSLEPLKKTLYDEFEKALFNNESHRYDNDFNKKIEALYKEFEITFKRSLAPLELDRIDEWIHNEFTPEAISYALKTAAMRNRLSIKAVENILLKNKSEKDVLSEGYSTQNSKISDEETQKNIEILKTRWTDEKK